MLRWLIGMMVAAVMMLQGGAAQAEATSRDRLDDARPVSQAEMAGLLQGLLKGRPEVADQRVEKGDLVVTAAGRELRFGLGPLSDQLNALPNAASRQQAFDKLAQRIEEAVTGRLPVKTPAEQARFRSALILVLKNRSYADEFAAMAGRQGAPLARLLHEPLAGDLIAAVALDLPQITRFVSVGEGGVYGLSDRDMLRIARDNWVRRVERLEIHDYGKVRTLHVGGGDQDASILLLDNPWRLVPNLPARLAIAVPARDILAFGDAEAVAKLRALIAAPDGGFPISKRLYTLGPRGLAPLP